MSEQPAATSNGLFGDIFGNSFFGPLLAGGAGLWLGGLRGGLAGLSYQSDLAGQQAQNALAQQREDTLTTAIRDLAAQQTALRDNLPAYQYGGQLFGNVSAPQGLGNAYANSLYAGADKSETTIHRPTPIQGPGATVDSNVPTINFDEMFLGPQAALDSYRQSIYGGATGRGVGRGREGGGVDLTLDELSRDPAMNAVSQAYNQSRQDIGAGNYNALNALNAGLINTGKLFGDARLEQGSLVDQVDLPSSDLAPVLAARLAGIGEASRTSQEFSQQALAGNASMYGGLGNLGKQSDYIASASARDRAMRGSQATAETRQEELAAGQFNAGIQSQLANAEAQINTALATEQARQQNILYGNIAQTGLQTGGALSELAQLFGGQQAGINQWYDQANTGIRQSNRQVGLQNAGVLAGLEGEAANARGNRGLALNDAINRSIGLESGLLGNAMSGQLGLGGILQPFLQQNQLSFGSLFPALFPDFGYQGDQGGGSQFGLDLGGLAGGLAAGAGTALAGAGTGLFGGGAGAGLGALTGLMAF